jgi:hypothetical protein
MARVRLSARRALAATAAAIGIGAMLTAGSPASADDCGGSGQAACPSAGLSVTGTVPVSESISLNVTSQSVDLTPGQTTTLFSNDVYLSTGNLFIGYTTNDTNGYTGTVSEPSPLTYQSNTIPDTDVAAGVYTNDTLGWDSFDNSGDPITLLTTTQRTGLISTCCTIYSNYGNDYLNSNLEISTPGNQPSGDYSASFVYSIIGS